MNASGTPLSSNPETDEVATVNISYNMGIEIEEVCGTGNERSMV
jgi:hypothetical protein